jgi:hypothetical protein
MASGSPETDPATYFGFKDLNGFKDFVVYVLSCAPDLFPYDDWREPDQQVNLDRAFVGLRYGLDVAAREKGESLLLAQCRELVEGAHADYREGRDVQGQSKLEEVENLLKNLPSQ